MNCKQCGAQIDEEVTLCPSCGADVNASEAAEAEAIETEASEAAENEAPEATEVEETETEAEDTGETSEDGEDQEPDGFTDDAEFSGEALPEKARKKGFLPFIISLAVIAALGVGAFFLFFWQSDDVGSIMRNFNQFSAAFEKGDIAGMNAVVLPEEVVEDTIPLFGPAEDMKTGLQEEYFSDWDIDFTTYDTMIKSYIDHLRMTIVLRGREDVVVNTEEQTATLYIDYTFYEGEMMQKQWMNFHMVKQDGTWYITFAQL